MKFSTGEVQKITKIEKMRLYDWRQRGYINPSIHKGEGPGDRDIWSQVDLYQIALFKHLVEESKFPRKLSAKFLSQGVLKAVSQIREIGLIAYMRKQDRIAAIPIQSKTGKINIPQLASIVGMAENGVVDFDDVYIIHFAKIVRQIDSAIFGLTKTKNE